jgi:hypothetical protein
MGIRATLHLYRRAIREGWDVPEEMRARIINEAFAVIEDHKQPPRVVLLASWVILDADKANLRGARLRLRALIARCKALGKPVQRA